jgi:flagellar assembly protein FliH
VDERAVEREAREQGLAEGMRAAEESYRAKIGRVDSLSGALQDEREGFFDRVEPELVRLAVSIAEKILDQELELRPELVVDMVRSAMKRLRDRERLRVSVNPRDFEQVRSARDDLIAAVDGVRKLEVVEDRRVDPGGCVIESQNGTLDARIRTQVDEITRALEGVMPDGEEGDGDGPGPLRGDDQED